MRIFNKVKLAAIQTHLYKLKTGVMLDKHDLPSLDDHRWHGYKTVLSNDDLYRIILWWENETYTKNETCRVADLLPSANELERVQSFIAGSVSNGLLPLDLRSVEGMEICILTNSLDGDFLYVIDGNHRLIAHWFQRRKLDDVPAYLVVHEDLKSWAYIPEYWQKQWRP